MSNIMKQFPAVYLRCICILLACVVLGFTLLLVVNTIPTQPIHGNMKESISVFEKEGDYPALHSWCFSQLDNWTDATILKIAAYDGEEPLLDRTLLAFRYNAEKGGKILTSSEGLIAYYGNDAEAEMKVDSYPRYWHGYLLAVKPLLAVLNYSQIRIVNLLFQNLLVFVVSVMFWKKNLKYLVIPWLIAWCAMVPTAMCMSLQFSSVFYVMVTAIIVLMARFDRIVATCGKYYYFLLVGIATSYIDFLTYPIATLGIPMVVYFCLKKDNRVVDELIDIVVLSVVWGCGYVGMWASKWVLASVLTSENVIANAIQTIALRTAHTAGSGEAFSILQMYLLHFKGFCKNPIMVVACLFAGICVWKVLRSKRPVWHDVLIGGIIACMPLAWYFAASNHSFVHWWFTCKGLVVSLFSILCFGAKAATDYREKL